MKSANQSKNFSSILGILAPCTYSDITNKLWFFSGILQAVLTKNHSFVLPSISQRIPTTALYLYSHLITARNTTLHSHLIIINLVFWLQTTQLPVNAPPSTHESPRTLTIIRSLCTRLQKQNSACFADAFSTHLMLSGQPTDEVFELHQKLTFFSQFF